MKAAVYQGALTVIIFQLLGGPFVTGYLLYMGASSIQIGIVLAIPSMANMTQIIGALLIQRLTNRKLMFSLLCGFHRFLWVFTGALPFIVPKQYGVTFYILVCAVAFFSQAIGSVWWTSLFADIVPAKLRGRYTGFRNTILWLGGCIAILVFGQVLDRFPEPTGFYILYATAAVCAVLDVLTYFMYPNIPFQKSGQINTAAMLQVPFRNKVFLYPMLFIALWLFLQSVSVPFFNYVMMDVMKLGYNWISVITMVYNVAMMLAYTMWGNFNARISTKTLLFWTMPVTACACISWGLLAVFPAIPVLLLIHILAGVGVGGFNQLIFNFVVGDTPKGDRPMYIAVFYGLTGLAGFLGPLFGGAVYNYIVDMAKWLQLYGVSLGVGVLLLAVAAIGSKVMLSSPVGRRRSAETSYVRTNNTE
jgi:MFS family permease